MNWDKCKKYKLTDEIKKELVLDPSEYEKCPENII